MKVKVIILVFLLSSCSSYYGQVLAQKMDFKIYSVNDGLPHSQVHDIEQTHDGFMWFATLGGGVTRFDGVNFTTYTQDDGLNSDLVEVVFEDSKNRLWAATEAGGVYRMEGNRFVNPFPDDSLSQYTVLNISEFRNGNMWFATYDQGIFIYEGKQLKRLGTKDGLPHNVVWDFWERENGDILIATHKGLSVFDGSNFRNYDQEDGISGEKVFKIEKDPQGRFWLATSEGVTIWDGQSFETIRNINGRDLNYVYDVLQADNGKMWIGTEHIGVFTYDGNSYEHITKKNGLSSNHIYSLFKDRSGSMWVATDDNGVNLFKGGAFKFYRNESGLLSDEVLSIHKAKDSTVWLGTYDGIFSYDGTTFEKQVEFSEFIISQEIWDIAELPNGNLLFLMPDNSIYEYNGRSFSNYTEKHNLEKWFTYDLFVDGDLLWIGTDEGLVRVTDNGFRKFMSEDGLASNVVRYIYRGSRGNLWIATYNGLTVYDGSEFKSIDLKDGLSHSEINIVIEDSLGNLWLGTGGGVSVLKRVEESDEYEITNFGREIGMKLLDTQLLWFDAMGYLWQGTNAGFHRLDVPNYRKSGIMNLVHYPLTEEGMGIETAHKAYTPISGGRVLVGTMKGMLELDPSEVRESGDALEVYLNDITANSNEIEWGKLADSLTYKVGLPQFPEITFPYWNRSLTFSFVAPDFEHPQNIRYRYKLEGFEEGWMPVTKSRSATYTNIDPGEYTFIVEAGNGNNRWSPRAASFSFSIEYPFWQTYWFYSLVVLTILSIGYLYTRLRLHALEKNKLSKLVDEQTMDLKKALEEKEVLIKEIHHRVKNNLAVISGMLELQMEYSADDFAIRTLNESQRRVQSIAMIHEKLYENERLSEIDFQKYIEELLEVISYSFSLKNKNINLTHQVDNISLNIDQAIPCGLILNELVSNAYEHAFNGRKEGSISVAFTKNGKGISFSVTDDGCGLPEDMDMKKDDTLGVTLVETFTLQLKGELEVESSDKGTSFSIHFNKDESMKKVFH